MKSLILVLTIILSIFVLNVNYGISQETIRLTNGEWAPYFSKKLEHYGIGSRIITDAFALEGIQVEYGFFPWKRSFTLAKQGIWDGAVGWESNPEKERFFYVSDPVWKAPWVFFYLKTHPFDWKTFDDLKDIPMGGTLGYMYTRDFMAAERAGKIKVDRAHSDQLGFQKLLKGRFEIFPQIIGIGYYQLKELFEPETVNLFTHHPTAFGQHTEHLLLSKKYERNKRLIKIFNRGLQRLKDKQDSGSIFVPLKEIKERTGIEIIKIRNILFRAKTEK